MIHFLPRSFLSIVHEVKFIFYIFFQVITAFDCSDMFRIQRVIFLVESRECQP